MDTDKLISFFRDYEGKNKRLEKLQKGRKANEKPKKVDEPISAAMAFGCFPILGIVAGAIITIIIFFLFDLNLSENSGRITGCVVTGFVFVLGVYGGIDSYIEGKRNAPFYQQYLSMYAAWEAEDKEYERQIEELKKSMPSFKEVKAKIFDGVNQQLKLPFKEEWITKATYSNIIDSLIGLLDLKEQTDTEKDPVKHRQLLMQFSDGKLKFFYAYSLKYEAGDNQRAYTSFHDQYLQAYNTHNALVLRADKEEKQILGGKSTQTDVSITRCKALLDDNRMEPLLTKLEEAKHADTSVLGLGLFTSTDKLAAKTKTLQDLCKAAKAEYDELTNVNTQLGDLLTYVRLTAYKNIYLCVDLVSFIRANAGGNKLTTQKDSVEMAAVKMDEVAVNTGDISMDMGANIGSTLGEIGNRLLDSKSFRKFATKNPKMAAGAAAIEVAQNLLKERNETIEKNNQLQAQLIKNIDQIVDSYNYGKGEMMRVIEIIKAIAKANKGVVKIYADLRDKYFTQNAKPIPQMEMMKDLQALAKATQEYKHISDSKI